MKINVFYTVPPRLVNMKINVFYTVPPRLPLKPRLEGVDRRMSSWSEADGACCSASLPMDTAGTLLIPNPWRYVRYPHIEISIK